MTKKLISTPFRGEIESITRQAGGSGMAEVRWYAKGRVSGTESDASVIMRVPNPYWRRLALSDPLAFVLRGGPLPGIRNEPMVEAVKAITDVWVDDPPARETASILNDTKAKCCPHNLLRCVMRCGIQHTMPERDPMFPRSHPPLGPRWEPIPEDERQEYLANAIHSLEQ